MKTAFEREAMKHALRKLLDPESHFCIIDFDSVMRLAGILVPTAERDTFRVFHCVSYRNMARETKEALIEHLGEILQRGPDPMFTLRDALAEPAQPPRPTIEFNAGWFARMLGK